jgi:hypothetical protein
MIDLERQCTARRDTGRSQQRKGRDRRGATAQQAPPPDSVVCHAAALCTVMLNQRFLHAPGTFRAKHRPMQAAPVQVHFSLVGMIR